MRPRQRPELQPAGHALIAQLQHVYRTSLSTSRGVLANRAHARSTPITMSSWLPAAGCACGRLAGCARVSAGAPLPGHLVGMASATRCRARPQHPNEGARARGAGQHPSPARAGASNRNVLHAVCTCSMLDRNSVPAEAGANLAQTHALPRSVMAVEDCAAGHPLIAPWSQQEGHPVAAEHPFARLCTTGRPSCATPSTGPRVLGGSGRSPCMCWRERTSETPAPAAVACADSDHSAETVENAQKHAFSVNARRACSLRAPPTAPTPTYPYAPLGA